MESGKQFDLNQAIANYRAKLAATGSFTQDNLEELESHLWEKIDAQSEEISDEAAFEIAVEELGNRDDLVKEYAKNNRKLIFQNYLWIMAVGMVIWMLLNELFFHLNSIMLSLAKPFIPAIYWDYGGTIFGIFEGIIISVSLLGIWKAGPRIYSLISAFVRKRPLISVILGAGILVLPILLSLYLRAYIVVSMDNVLLYKRYLFRPYILFVAPILVFLFALWKHSSISRINKLGKLEGRIRLCMIAGPFIKIFLYLVLNTAVWISYGLSSRFEFWKYLIGEIAMPKYEFIVVYFLFFFMLFVWGHHLIPSFYQSINTSTKSRFSFSFLVMMMSLFICFCYVNFSKGYNAFEGPLGVIRNIHYGFLPTLRPAFVLSLIAGTIYLYSKRRILSFAQS